MAIELQNVILLIKTIAIMDIRTLDLNLLLVLDALHDEQSVTGAARRLKVSQPTVSVALNRLRVALGDDLFVRHAGGMVPTTRALRLREPVRKIIETVVAEVLPSEQFDPAGATAPFTFCLSDIGEMVFLPSLMERLRGLAPQAPIVSVSLRPAELARALEAGQVDLALGYFPDLGTGIHRQGLFDHPFVCLARKGHPHIAGELTKANFAALDHMVVSDGGRSQELFERVVSEFVDSSRVVLRTPHFMSAPIIVAKSDLVITVPKAVGQIWAARARLQILPPPIDLPTIPLKQFWHRRFNGDARLSWLRGIVAAMFLGRDPSRNPEFADLRA